MLFLPFTKDIPTATTRVQILNSPQRVKLIHFHAIAANGGLVYVGDSSVSASASGRELSADAWFEVDFKNGSVLMSVFWADTSNSGDDVDGWAVLE